MQLTDVELVTVVTAESGVVLLEIPLLGAGTAALATKLLYLDFDECYLHRSRTVHYCEEEERHTHPYQMSPRKHHLKCRVCHGHLLLSLSLSVGLQVAVELPVAGLDSWLWIRVPPMEPVRGQRLHSGFCAETGAVGESAT